MIYQIFIIFALDNRKVSQGRGRKTAHHLRAGFVRLSVFIFHVFFCQIGNNKLHDIYICVLRVVEH